MRGFLSEYEAERQRQEQLGSELLADHQRVEAEDRTEEVEFLKTTGTDPHEILEDETKNALDFLTAMKREGMPHASTLRIAGTEKTVKAPKKGLFARTQTEVVYKTTRGYQIAGRTKRILVGYDQDKKPKYKEEQFMLFICEDGKIRESEPISKNTDYNYRLSQAEGMFVGNVRNTINIQLGRVSSRHLQTIESSWNAVSTYEHSFGTGGTFSDMLVSIATGK